MHESGTAEDARRAVLALLAMGLDAEAHRIQVHVSVPDAQSETHGDSCPRAPHTLWQISTAEEQAKEADAILADFVTPPDRPSAPLAHPVVGPANQGGIWTLQHASGSLMLAAACTAVHMSVHGLGPPASRSDMIAAGSVAPWMVRDGQWWRLLSAVFLHFDFKHLVGNLSALLLLGPPLAVTLGQARMILLFVVTAFAGNAVSQGFGDEVAVKAGASGGICGLLGALAGVATVAMATATDARERRPAWQTLGALVALFGLLVGFQPGSDHYAHVGGLLSGLVLGGLLAQPPAAIQAGPEGLPGESP